MRISHEAIYQSLYIQGRGALKRELVGCLRTSRALRAPRERSLRKTWAHVTPETLISERPAESRTVPSPAMGGRSADRSGALGDRHGRRTRHEVHDAGPPAPRGGLRREPRRPRNVLRRPAQADTKERSRPGRLRRDLDDERPGRRDDDAARATGTVGDLDRGKETSAHAQFKVETGIPVFFRRPPVAVAARHKRTPTVCCLSTSTRARICRAGPAGRLQQSLTPSTPDTARPSLGRLLPRRSTSAYCSSSKSVLRCIHRLNPAQFRSRKFAAR